MPIRRTILKLLFLSETKRHLRHGRPQVASFAFDHITAKIHIDGRFEDDELLCLETRLFPNLPAPSVCLDIGANIGNHSIAFADHFSKVHAFEPNPNAFRLLEINARLKNNIEAHMVGCSSKEAEIEVVETAGNIGGTSVENANKPEKGRRVVFRVAPLDQMEMIKDFERVSFVKIDVEGHEPEAIKGASETLLKHQPVIAFEVDRKTVSDGTNDTVAALRALGYDHYYSVSRTNRLKRALRLGAMEIAPMDLLKKRNYPMVLASTSPIALRS